MLATAQPVLRRFWYPVIPIELLQRGPQSFTLLGEPLVLWLDADGKPSAVRDRCCHRSTPLSQGIVVDGNIRCPYHGWQFNSEGSCVVVPQAPDSPIPENYCVQNFQCQERYGYAWVCLGDSLDEILSIPEAEDPSYRQIHAFYETWHCSGLRLIENVCDHGHFHFVHNQTLADRENPVSSPHNVLEKTERGFYFESILFMHNNPHMEKNVGSSQKTMKIIRKINWCIPFGLHLQEMMDGKELVQVSITYATPINDFSCQMVRFLFRNDTEAEAKAADIITHEGLIFSEDRAILETIDYDVPLNLNEEVHMATDKPGILMRHKLAALLASHGEVEQRRTAASAMANARLI